MRKRILVLILSIVALTALGCARHVVHHHRPHGHANVKQVTVLENEHSDRKVVVVHQKPHPKRHCWKHVGHWHCARH